MKYLLTKGPEEVASIPHDNFVRELQQSIARTQPDNLQEAIIEARQRLNDGDELEFAGRTFRIER